MRTPRRAPAGDERLSPYEPSRCPTTLQPANISAVTATELWRRGQEGWPRSFPIAQFPNPPLLLAFGGLALAAATDHAAHDIGRAVFTIGLGVWAWEEAVDGVNWFRHLIGVGALVWIVARLAGEL